jgi:hypothetical protein
MTGKLLFSFKTPTFFIGRWTTGYSPKRLLYQTIFQMAWMIFINALIIYLIVSGPTGDITPIFLVLLPITFGMTIFSFLMFRPLVKLVGILERQPVPRV